MRSVQAALCRAGYTPLTTLRFARSQLRSLQKKLADGHIVPNDFLAEHIEHFEPDGDRRRPPAHREGSEVGTAIVGGNTVGVLRAPCNGFKAVEAARGQLMERNAVVRDHLGVFSEMHIARCQENGFNSAFLEEPQQPRLLRWEVGPLFVIVL